jgi:uncharacterized protein DUF6599
MSCWFTHRLSQCWFSLPRYGSTAAALLALVLCPFALAGTPTSSSASSFGFLPASFAGWELSGTPQLGSDPRKIDNTSASVLSEDRFLGYELATYKRDDRTLTIKAARFADAGGAYAAFTFYRQPLMRAEDVGSLAASLNDRVLFFTGNLLVDAQFDRVTGMSGAQLRELASRLPQATGPAAALPTLPNYLPRKQLVPQSARYLIGPAAYSALNIDVNPSLIDFSKSPELLWARLNGESPGSAEILLIAYPTPHIAMQKLPTLEQLATPAAGETSVARRSGPILALVRGNISAADAARILDGINYDANVTWNENTGLGKRDNIGAIVIAALSLAAVLFLMSVAAGAVFGFGRFLLPRIRAKTGGQPPDDGKMIRLDLHS